MSNINGTQNARVVWCSGKRVYNVHECYDKSWALCKWYIQENRDDPQYAGGTLKVVSMDLSKKVKEFK